MATDRNKLTILNFIKDNKGYHCDDVCMPIEPLKAKLVLPKSAFKLWQSKSRDFTIVITPRNAKKFPIAPFVRPLSYPEKQQKRKARPCFFDSNIVYVHKKQRCQYVY